MRFFGQGHADDGDDEGGLICMISNSRLPNDYEPGRFHIFKLEYTLLSSPRPLPFLVDLENMVELLL